MLDQLEIFGTVLKDLDSQQFSLEVNKTWIIVARASSGSKGGRQRFLSQPQGGRQYFFSQSLLLGYQEIVMIPTEFPGYEIS